VKICWSSTLNWPGALLVIKTSALKYLPVMVN